MGILLLNSYGKYLPRRRVIEGGLIALGILLGAAVGRRADQPLPPARRRAGRARPVGGDVAAGGRRGHRVLRRRRLRARRHPVADPAPGGPARGRPRPRLRRPRHARVGRELPADHHRRPDLGLRRDDRRSSSSWPIGVLGVGVGSVLFRDPNLGVDGRDRRSPRRGPDRGGPRHGPADVARGPGAPSSRLPVDRRAGRQPAAESRRHGADAGADRRARPTRPTATEARPMPRVAVVFTGGTISMALRPGRRRQRPDPRRGRDPGPDARARRDRRGRARSTAAGRRPATSRSPTCSRSGRRPRARSPTRRSTARSSSRGPTRSRRRSFCLGPPARRPEAGRRDRGDAGVRRARVRRAGQPARRRRGRGVAVGARSRGRGLAWRARSSRPTTS